MTLVVVTALIGATSALTAAVRGRKVALAEVPVLTKNGEARTRRMRRNV